MFLIFNIHFEYKYRYLKELCYDIFIYTLIFYDNQLK